MEFVFLLIKTIPLTYTALLPVVNPIGCSVMFYSLTPEASREHRKQVAKKIAFYTFVVLLVVLFGGVYILQVFGISIPVIEVCGGLVIAVMGWDLLQQKEESEAKEDASEKDDHPHGTAGNYIPQAFYPFTFPFTVGPGVLAVMLAVGAHVPSSDSTIGGVLEYAGASIGVALMAMTVYFGYAYAERVVDKLTPDIRKVIMRILSFILLCIGGQIIWTGVLDLLKEVG